MTELANAALETLYARVTRIAEDMKGTVTTTTESRSFEAAIVEPPKSENVRGLHVEMPGGFQVDFAPSRALGAPGNVLPVKAKRYLGGSRTDDWDSIFVQGEWQFAGKPVSDDDLRACLTPRGPKPAVY
jgi:hypothetical protein